MGKFYAQKTREPGGGGCLGPFRSFSKQHLKVCREQIEWLSYVQVMYAERQAVQVLVL